MRDGELDIASLAILEGFPKELTLEQKPKGYEPLSI